MAKSCFLKKKNIATNLSFFQLKKKKKKTFKWQGNLKF